MKIYSDDYRVYLRSLTNEHVKTLSEIGNDTEIAHNIAAPGEFPNPYTEENAVEFVEYSNDMLNSKTEYHLGIFLKADSTLIGVLGLMHVDMKNKKAELGYWLGKKYQRHGYATEALDIILHFGFLNLGLERVYAQTFSFNEGSKRLLEHIGFTLEGRLRKNTLLDEGFIDDYVYGLLKSEFNFTDRFIKIE
jgi:RimJ/RimL family protein N-acetyltransferase